MPLLKAILAQQLQSSLERGPASAPEAAADWANAYVGYASAALSSLGSLPVTAAANLPTLLGAFTAGLQAMTSQGAGALVAQGVMAFWSTMVWTGPAAAGVTVSPGNPALASALGAIFADTSGGSTADKARDIADAFNAGAKLVIVSDVPFVQPAPPVVGPIS